MRKDLFSLQPTNQIQLALYTPTDGSRENVPFTVLYVCLIRIHGSEPSESEGIFGFLMKNGLSEVPSEFSANDSFISKG